MIAVHKSSLDDLAVFGGPPAFADTLHVGRPNVGDRARLLERFNDILDRRWFTNDGPYVQEFERTLAARVGVRHCIAICNATVALEILIRALELTGEVIVPSFTFIATAHALQWQGITPVFCDIDPRTYTLDPREVEACISTRTTGILGVHLWGRPCDVDALAEVAARHRLALLFDAAHALGCTERGHPIGGFGRAEVFSFHATKFCTSFEGGAVATNDGELAARVRLMRNFGFAGNDEVVSLGTNGKMSEVSAAMGLTSMESLDHVVATNRSHHAEYAAGLRALRGVQLLRYDDQETCNYQYVILELEPELAGLARDALVDVLRAENVAARRYFHPGCHRMEPYRSARLRRPLPVTERLSARVMALPTGTAITTEQISSICRIVRLAVEHGPEITQRLAGTGESTPRHA
jgi:dTDP-4-amino-4,6-dideoxygalactose transaminase